MLENSMPNESLQTAVPICPDCKRPLDVIAACGSISYFCDHCNLLKSSKRVREANPELFKETE
ncbi:zinc-ribbon domain-containing protein [Iodobacter arcticus]|uniref:Zinc-ribbon domain-containing protein n=1 Tax=Iodobacter arcticus TaxID=590593 RepID=A0ABW2R2Q5_9NEIS